MTQKGASTDRGDIGGIIAAIGVIGGLAYTVIRNRNQDKTDVVSNMVQLRLILKTSKRDKIFSIKEWIN